MAFWGVEVKAGVPLKVQPAEPTDAIHLSQAALGELKKNETVTLFVTVDDKKVVLGHLSADKMPQLSFDLVFEKEVELSHNSKGSVFFAGYQATQYEEDSDLDSDDEEDEHEQELIHFTNEANDDKKAAPAAAKANNAKPDSSSKQKAKSAQPVKGDKAESESDDSDEDDSDDSSDEDDSSDDEEGSLEEMAVDSDSDNEDGSSDSEEEEPPKKAGKGSNKRPIDSPSKTPLQVKKQKSDTPKKSEGKKAVHTATPHPAKGKSSANGPSTKSGSSTKEKTPAKSDGKFSCGSCERAFGSDTALQSHSKAKHAAK